MVVEMLLYSQIWEAYISGESQRSIAKRLGVSRPSVKLYDFVVIDLTYSSSRMASCCLTRQ